MDLDNFIIGKTKKRRGEERGDLAKKQQLLSKHSATADGKRQDNKSWASPGRFGKKSNSSHLRVASSKTSSRSSKRRSSRSSKSSGVVVRVVV